MIGPSDGSRPAITTMKMTRPVQSVTLKAASGEILTLLQVDQPAARPPGAEGRRSGRPPISSAPIHCSRTAPPPVLRNGGERETALPFASKGSNAPAMVATARISPTSRQGYPEASLPRRSRARLDGCHEHHLAHRNIARREVPRAAPSCAIARPTDRQTSAMTTGAMAKIGAFEPERRRPRSARGSNTRGQSRDPDGHHRTTPAEERRP